MLYFCSTDRHFLDIFHRRSKAWPWHTLDPMSHCKEHSRRCPPMNCLHTTNTLHLVRKESTREISGIVISSATSLSLSVANSIPNSPMSPMSRQYYDDPRYENHRQYLARMPASVNSPQQKPNEPALHFLSLGKSLTSLSIHQQGDARA